MVAMNQVAAPIQSATSGPEGLKNDLSVAAAQTSTLVNRRIFEMLLQFETLTEPTKQVVLEQTKSPDPTIQILSLEIMSKADPSTYLPLLSDILLNSSLPFPPGVEALCDILEYRSTLNDLEALEKFVHSPYTFLRVNAMLCIRRIRSTKSVPFLIQELNAPDSMVQYEAVITLAEITGRRNGEFGPGLGPFNRYPGRYTLLWKQWWAGSDSQRFKNSQD